MKRSIIVLLTASFYFTLSAQHTFIKRIDDVSPGSLVRVLPTSDQGWVLFSSDSLKLYKFNSCGDLQWAKKYLLPNIISCGADGNEIITTQTGGFIFLIRVQLNANIKASMLTNLDASGNIIWSKWYGDSLYSQCPYTIGQDNTGNFILYANVSKLGGGGIYNMICKINSNGDVIWTQFYNHGGTWGGAIVTSDNGVLTRGGDLFMKTDSLGNVEWATKILSAGTSYYIRPVEVGDGYIFNKSNSGTNEITFYKMDKLGNLLWNGRKTLDYLGTPPALRKKSNGNFAAVFGKTISGKNYTTVVEFDKDLNVVNQSSVNYSQSGIELYGKDINFLNDSTSILVGTATVNAVPYLFFAKMNSQYQTNCDTSLEINITDESVTQSFESTNVISHNFYSVNKNYTVDSFSVSTITLCGDTAPFDLNIGNDTVLCADAVLTLENNTNSLFDNYLWSTGETTAAITINQPGTYWLRASNSCRTDTVTDTVTVSAVNLPDPSLISDTSVCSNDSVLLDAEIAGATYLWQDGSTSPVYNAKSSGLYWVEVTDTNNCKARDSVNITFILPQTVNIGNDITICQGETLILDATNSNTTYLWQDNSTSPTFSVTLQGVYWVEASTICGTVSDTVVVELDNCDCYLCIADAFTPDGSGIDINNKLYVFNKLGYKGDALETINFKIFNRWGEMIFEASEKSQIVYPEGGWDGTHIRSGEKMEIGVYVWLLEAKTTQGVKMGPIGGNVSLIR